MMALCVRAESGSVSKSLSTQLEVVEDRRPDAGMTLPATAVSLAATTLAATE